MNVKKYLKEKAKKDHEEILAADNGELLSSLQSMVKEKPKTVKTSPRLKGVLAGIAGALAAVVLVICVVIFYPFNKDVVYSEDNFILKDSSVEELNGDMREFALHVDDSTYSIITQKTVDSVSGDTVFYKTRFQRLDSLINFELVAVSNKHYKYPELHEEDELLKVELPNYELSYWTQLTFDSVFGLNTLTGFGVIHLGSEYMYITNYSEFTLDENGSFFDIIQSIIQVR